MVGKGGSSKVYKGCLPDGKELAVKILKPSEAWFKVAVAARTVSHRFRHIDRGLGKTLILKHLIF